MVHGVAADEPRRGCVGDVSDITLRKVYGDRVGRSHAPRKPDYCELSKRPMLGSLNRRVSASLSTSLTSLVLVSWFGDMPKR